VLYYASSYSRQRLEDVPLHQFVLCYTVLNNYVDVVNDLGVLVDLDPHLTFEAHIDNIVQK